MIRSAIASCDAVTASADYRGSQGNGWAVSVVNLPGSPLGSPHRTGHFTHEIRGNFKRCVVVGVIQIRTVDIPVDEHPATFLSEGKRVWTALSNLDDEVEQIFVVRFVQLLELVDLDQGVSPELFGIGVPVCMPHASRAGPELSWLDDRR